MLDYTRENKTCSKINLICVNRQNKVYKNKISCLKENEEIDVQDSPKRSEADIHTEDTKQNITTWQQDMIMRSEKVAEPLSF